MDETKLISTEDQVMQNSNDAVEMGEAITDLGKSLQEFKQNQEDQFGFMKGQFAAILAALTNKRTPSGEDQPQISSDPRRSSSLPVSFSDSCSTGMVVDNSLVIEDNELPCLEDDEFLNSEGGTSTADNFSTHIDFEKETHEVFDDLSEPILKASENVYAEIAAEASRMIHNSTEVISLSSKLREGMVDVVYEVFDRGSKRISMKTDCESDGFIVLDIIPKPNSSDYQPEEEYYEPTVIESDKINKSQLDEVVVLTFDPGIRSWVLRGCASINSSGMPRHSNVKLWLSIKKILLLSNLELWVGNVLFFFDPGGCVSKSSNQQSLSPIMVSAVFKHDDLLAHDIAKQPLTHRSQASIVFLRWHNSGLLKMEKRNIEVEGVPLAMLVLKSKFGFGFLQARETIERHNVLLLTSLQALSPRGVSHVFQYELEVDCCTFIMVVEHFIWDPGTPLVVIPFTSLRTMMLLRGMEEYSGHGYGKVAMQNGAHKVFAELSSLEIKSTATFNSTEGESMAKRVLGVQGEYGLGIENRAGKFSNGTISITTGLQAHQRYITQTEYFPHSFSIIVVSFSPHDLSPLKTANWFDGGNFWPIISRIEGLPLPLVVALNQERIPLGPLIDYVRQIFDPGSLLLIVLGSIVDLNGIILIMPGNLEAELWISKLLLLVFDPGGGCIYLVGTVSANHLNLKLRIKLHTTS